MRVLVLCDDHWHPGSTVRQGLLPLEAKGYSFEFVSDAKDWSAALMAEFPLTILSKSNNVTASDDTPWVTPAVEEAFQSYLRAGHGLLVTHSGTVYKDYAVLRSVMGGAFLQHPKKCPVTVFPKTGHALTAGAATFTVNDEHYFVALDDATADVFMTSQSSNGVQPAGWTRREGAGRVCVLTPGHTVEVWLQNDFQKLLVNALQWCSPAQ